MKRDLWGADSFRFYVQGENPQRFVNLAAEEGIRLARIRWGKACFSAQGAGRDFRRLRQIAFVGGWRFEVCKRCGPGRLGEFFLGRPGLILGALLFLVLTMVMHQLIWSIDFGNLSEESCVRIRSLLADCGIQEGSFLSDENLAKAQTLALQQSDLFGWISLNFAGGCLFIEDTRTQTQEIRAEPAETPLYAKTDGKILAVESESGFPVVLPGQTVVQGELLVDTKRLDRNGKEIRQGTDGRIVAQCQKSYTSVQPLQTEVCTLTGKCLVKDQFFLFGIQGPNDNGTYRDQDLIQTEWIPLHIGRLNLPGCIRRTTVWEQAVMPLHYSSRQAQALARRSCREQLYTEFPDAVITAENCKISQQSREILCTVTYQFEADIAAPLE